MAIKKINSNSGRPKILKAAARLFLANGFSGTSMSDIAKQADVPKSLIYHHFVDKEALWKSVKIEIAKKSISTEAADIPLNKGLRAFLEAIIWQRFELYQNNPQVSRLMAWQNLESKKEAIEGGTHSPDSWLPMIKILQKQKDINPRLIPEHVVGYLAGALAPVTNLPVNLYFSDKAEMKKYVEWIIPLMEKNLKP